MKQENKSYYQQEERMNDPSTTSNEMRSYYDNCRAPMEPEKYIIFMDSDLV